MTTRPITEDDLHGFVDQRLEPKRVAEVQAYVAEHPEIAARINGYGRQRDMLRTALAPPGPVTPLGGLLLIAGWGWLFLSLLRRPSA